MGQIRVWDAEGEDWKFETYPPTTGTQATPAEELRELIREAHGVQKDMRGLLKQVDAKLEEMDKRAHIIVDDALTERVSAGLEAYHEMIEQSSKEASEAVYRKFDLIYKTLIGDTPAQRRKNGFDLEETIGIAMEGDKDALKKRIAEAMAVNPVEGVTP